MSSYVYGPVPSRRLGRSLGVDLVPFKTCPFDCVYCQLGRTTNKTLRRAEYVPAEQVIEQVRRRLGECDRPDYVTLSGSGEPTLHIRLGWIIEQLRQFSQAPIALLTNGALLSDPQVRSEAASAEVVLPSLDAGDEQRFQYVNRPCEGLTLARVVEGLEQFRREYRGQLWLEVFLLAGVTAMEAEVRKIRTLIDRIQPDRIHLNTVVRPPAEQYAQAVPDKRLQQLRELFGPNAEVIADFDQPVAGSMLQPRDEEVLAMLRRRPCRGQDVAAGLSIHLNDALKRLAELVRQGLVREHFGHEGHYFEAVRDEQRS